MKKFQFPLDHVLNYKEQQLDALRNQHAMILHRMKEEQQRLEEFRKTYEVCSKEFQHQKSQGFTIQNAYTYELYLYHLLTKIDTQKQVIAQLQHTEKEKKEQVILAKIDAASIDKLKEKMKAEHNLMEQKSQEILMDEFVSHGMSHRL